MTRQFSSTQKIMGIIAAAVIILVAGWMALFSFKNYRGIGPALFPPPKDITQTINTTGMPLKLPPGFSIEIFAKNLPGARVMALDPFGNFLVSMTSAGVVMAVKDTDGDGVADKRDVVLRDLNRPHGLAVRCPVPGETCELYVAETHRIGVYDYTVQSEKPVFRKTVVDLPSGGGHYTRTINFTDDMNHLLVSIGSSCNVCDESDDRRASIMLVDLTTDPVTLEPYATGLRNSVFMAQQYVTGDIWATEMGRDYLGDDLPPDEINIIREGKDYGWPICYGKNIHDTDFDKNTYIRDPCADKEPSAIDIPAHSAPLGLAFIPEEGWPEEYWYNLLVAYHGSWNRSEPTGYKIVRYKLDAQGNYLGEEDFISGWISKDGALGRPVDIYVQPGGTMFITDDKAGVIYRVTYGRVEPSSEDKLDLIRVETPQPNAEVRSPLTVRGEARGNWYFEASFPVKLLDANGKVLAHVPAQAQGEWMTTEYVPFEATLTFSQPTTETGTLVLEKDNPSGLPQYADELRILVRFAE